MNHPSRSDEQQAVEPMVLALLAAQSGLVYTAEKISCGDERVQIDGVGRDANGKIVELVEVYAHQGKLKGAQLKKPIDDAARLVLAQKYVAGTPKLRLAWCCKEAVGQVQRGWRGRALEAMRVELFFADLDTTTDHYIRQAQIRQKR